MEFLTRFVFYGIGVFLEPIDMLPQVSVFFFELLDLVLELLLLAALAIPGGKSMASVDDAPGECERKHNGKDSAGGTPTLLKPLNGPLPKGKRLVGRLLFWTEQVWVLHSASTGKVVN